VEISRALLPRAEQVRIGGSVNDQNPVVFQSIADEVDDDGTARGAWGLPQCGLEREEITAQSMRRAKSKKSAFRINKKRAPEQRESAHKEFRVTTTSQRNAFFSTS
jgi:hypothetical protein